MKEVDDPDEVVEKAESGVHGAPLSARLADTLTLPAAAQKIDRPVKFQKAF